MKYTILRLRDIDFVCFWSKVDKVGQVTVGFGWHLTIKMAMVIFLLMVSHETCRVSYLLSHGKLSSHLEVCYTCDNPSCVNPKHLWQGTRRENIDDMLAKGQSLHGQTNPKAKLTPTAVQYILQLWQDGWLQKEIANRVGCNRRTVSAIVIGKQWSLESLESNMSPRKGRGPEWHIRRAVKEMLETRGWMVEIMVGSAFQTGIPDLYCFNRKWGERWIDTKDPDRYMFTKAQRYKWPLWEKAGIGIWILTAATQEQYDLLFKPPNWRQFVKKSWKMPTQEEIDQMLREIRNYDGA